MADFDELHVFLQNWDGARWVDTATAQIRISMEFVAMFGHPPFGFPSMDARIDQAGQMAWVFRDSAHIFHHTSLMTDLFTGRGHRLQTVEVWGPNGRSQSLPVWKQTYQYRTGCGHINVTKDTTFDGPVGHPKQP